MTKETTKGVRGFELDMHVAFMRPLSAAEAEATLLEFDSLHTELYRPHPRATPSGGLGTTGIPSARLIGALPEQQAFKAALAALLAREVKYAEVGLRGQLKSASGQIEWMPWRKNVVLSRQQLEQVAFEEGVKYVLE